MQFKWYLRVLLPIAMTLLFFSTHLHALINGEIYPANSVSTLRIQIQHEHFLRSIGKWEHYDSKCSAVVVGKKPLTLITAAHCLKEVKLNEYNKLPEIEILSTSEHGINNAKVTLAFYRPYEEVAENVLLDIAVLVFDAQTDKRLTPIPISKKLPSKNNTLLVCGFGKGYLDEESINPRCAKKNYLINFFEFNKVLPDHYKSKDQMLYIKSEAQFSYTKEIAKTKDSLIAINRLNNKGLYDENQPIITEGDSGGAWLTISERNQYSLLAISTLVERFYNKNSYWDFFSKDTPLSEYPYVAYGLRLDNEIIRNFLTACKNNGADIQFE